MRPVADETGPEVCGWASVEIWERYEIGWRDVQGLRRIVVRQPQVES